MNETASIKAARAVLASAVSSGGVAVCPLCLLKVKRAGRTAQVEAKNFAERVRAHRMPPPASPLSFAERERLRLTVQAAAAIEKAARS